MWKLKFLVYYFCDKQGITKIYKNIVPQKFESPGILCLKIYLGILNASLAIPVTFQKFCFLSHLQATATILPFQA